VRELVVLGTASQVPTRTRNQNGYLLRWDDQGILFDPGEGTQRQMLHAGVASTAITRICLTHVHGDHCLGLPGVLFRMALDGVPGPVEIHYPASGEEVVRGLLAAAGPPLGVLLRPHRKAGEVAPGLWVERLRHRTETYGYRLVEPDGRTMVPARLKAAGIRGADVGRLQRTGRLGATRVEDVSVARPGQRFALVMDTAVCDGAAALAEGADLLVMESTYAGAEAALAEQHLHLTAGQAGAIAAGGRARTLVLTHFSARYPDVAPLRDEAAAVFPGEVVAVDDLQRVPVPKRRGEA
jgi:ribonuclease Z